MKKGLSAYVLAGPCITGCLLPVTKMFVQESFLPILADAVAGTDLQQFLTHGPFISPLALAVAFAGALEHHAASVISDAANFIDFFRCKTHIGQWHKLADLVLDRTFVIAGFLQKDGHRNLMQPANLVPGQLIQVDGRTRSAGGHGADGFNQGLAVRACLVGIMNVD